MPAVNVVVVSGASRGLGRAMTEHLCTAGFDVIGTYRTDRAAAEETLRAVDGEPGRARFLALDVTRQDTFPDFVAAVRALLGELGADRLHGVINNAGIGAFTPFAETTVDEFDTMFDTNLRGPYFVTQHLLPLLGEGSRVLTLSTPLTRGVIPGGSVYAATKAAVEVTTRYLAVELAPRGILVNTLMGGAVDTDFADGIMRTDAVRELAAKDVALGRIGSPEDMTAAVPALMSPAFRWTTGSIIDVSGGQRL